MGTISYTYINKPKEYPDSDKVMDVSAECRCMSDKCKEQKETTRTAEKSGGNLGTHNLFIPFLKSKLPQTTAGDWKQM